MSRRWMLVVVALAAVGLAPAVAGAQQNVTLELVTEPGFPITGSQKWMSMLKDLEVANLRIRQGAPGDRANIAETGSGRSKSYAVTGLLTTRGQLIVPGARFTIDQKAQLKAWLVKVGSGALNEPQEELGTFGLTKEQFVATYEGLARPISFETRDQPVGDVVRKLVRSMDYTVDIDPSARRALDAGEVVLDELQGLSQGTALAAALRPAGLVFAPVRISKTEVRLKIADSRTLAESWPIGWPSQKALSQAIPVMTKFINVSINETPLSEVIRSVQGRVEVPFLFDHNGLVRNDIDLETRVSLPEGKTFYKAILDRLLAKASLKCEVRVDEADAPFVWISPVR